MACNCKDNAWKIGAYVDGELPEAEREALEQSLRSCPECRSQLEAFRALDRLTLPDAPPPVSGQEWASVLERVRRQPRLVATAPSRRAWDWLAPLGAVAALLAVAVLVGNALLTDPGADSGPEAGPRSDGTAASLPESPTDGVRTIERETSTLSPTVDDDDEPLREDRIPSGDSDLDELLDGEESSPPEER